MAMNALELADSRKEWANDLLSLNEWSIDAEKMLRKLEGQLAFRIDAIKSYQIKVEQQQAEILAGKIMIKGYSKTIDEQQAEIEALKAKLNKYHLKEDLDRNLNLIYGNEFIK